MFKFMGNVARSLFGGGENAKKAIEIADTTIKGIGTWVDERKYTDEERSKDISNAVEQYLEWVRLAMDQNGVRAVTRRVLAWSVVGVALFWASIAMTFAILDPFLQMWNIGTDEKPVFFPAGLIVNNMIMVSKEFWLGEAFVSVIVFYFGVWPAVHSRLTGGNKKPTK